ncbi:hypothetical protein GCM10022403_083530 [Streptomyces coacervatus]|uniref:Uncharacterized protein n=1 Tax=Streptomyces coacervatus TaxID=647381 RepID=A0ABP7JAX2_9ACTN|nr:hypothetical protein [Streptomyces coacervatus]MDF2270293.1 hypothetical protein [Streptomyces coacervatus]
MYQLFIAGLVIAAVMLSVLVVGFLAVTVRLWDAWWARAAHALVFLAAAAAVAFGIHWVIHALPPGGCVHHPCVTAPGD